MRTRLAKKRKINDLINNAPAKKAKVQKMTEIAEEYATNYEKCRNNESNYFNNCYKKENDLYMVG